MLDTLPDSLKSFINTAEEINLIGDYDETNSDQTLSLTSLQSWRAFLETPYQQIIPYREYVYNLGAFGTHQGVKGLEFDRVMVVIDDSEARGFSFSYMKLLGAKSLTSNDINKRASGDETGVDRTRRLLYVTCTRAEKSLAIVAYTSALDELANSVKAQGWFEASEIVYK